MSSEHAYNHDVDSYGEDNSRQEHRSNAASRRRTTQARKRNKGPQSVNGIHKRRRRKMAW